MRRITTISGLALGLALLAGCAEIPGELPTETGRAGAGVPSAAVTTSGGGVDAQRLRLDLAGWIDGRTVIPIHLFVPSAASDIGPGSAIVIEIPDEGRFGCTANFVWRAGGKRYLGSAGHCFLPEAATATHGAGADYDASGVVVEVCVDGCDGNFRTNLLLGTWVRLGKVAYARQQDTEGRGVGHDFGVVEIPKQIQEHVRPWMPVWLGPERTQELSLGDYGCHYGNGLGVGEVFATKARVGIGGGSAAEYWSGDFAAAFGDSGSGLVTCVNDGLGFHGVGAAGVLTHLGVRADPGSGQHGYVLGTTMARSIEMAREANLRLSLVLP